MPREPRGRAAPVATLMPTNSLIASGARYQGKVERIYRPLQAWQQECYRHYGICGEARFAARFFGHAMSRAVLYVATRDSDGNPIRVANGVSLGYLTDLASGPVGQGQMLEAIGVHLSVAGECFLVGRRINGRDVWEVVSVLEMKTDATQKTWTVDYGDGKAPVEVGNRDTVIRIWLPDPARRIEADAPFKALLPVLDEIEWATRHIFKQLSSRLAGSGILLFPSEATFAAPPVGGNGDADKPRTTTDEITGIMKMLADAMLIPLTNPESPAAAIPIVGKMPGEHIDKVKLLHFWSDVDEKAISIRDNAIHRFALGMDLPPEQVIGMGRSGTGGGKSNGVSHWGAWQIEESTIKMFVEPMLDVVANAITLYYLAPLTGVDPKEYVAYDTSALKLRPDRSQEAITLNAAGLLKDQAVLRENGFDPDDALLGEDLDTWLLRKTATGSATPDQVQAALKLLGVDLGIPMPAPDARPGNPLPSSPTQDNLPYRPRTPGDAQATLLPAAEALVLRALERAGNRIRQALDVKVPGVPAYAVHTMHHANGSAGQYLTDAWTTAPMVLDGFEDVPRIVGTLDAYCKSLMSTGEAHTRARLAEFLEAGCSPH